MMQYNDRNLQRMFAELDPKHRLKAFKSAFRRAANTVRKTAINNLRSSIRSDADLERGIRAIVWKRKAGFRVTIGTKRLNKKTGKMHGYHKTRQGDYKPILLWAEAGTKWRRSKTPTRYKVGTKWATGLHRGAMKRYGFMTKTLESEKERVTDYLHNEIIDSVTKVATKYGCK